MTLGEIVADFADGMIHADARRPVAVNMRSKQQFQPGIGPHSEAQTVELVMAELPTLKPDLYVETVGLAVPYPELPRQRCDLCFGRPKAWDWAVEVKMLRILGDNGKANDNILMHIFSPYPAHRSAVTDCSKLAATSLASKRAILIYGYDAKGWPLEPAIDAFEVLASRRVRLGTRQRADFSGLVHPVHASGRVYGWEIQNRPNDG
jgi:hypothetical protein